MDALNAEGRGILWDHNGRLIYRKELSIANIHRTGNTYDHLLTQETLIYFQFPVTQQIALLLKALDTASTPFLCERPLNTRYSSDQQQPP